MSSPKILLKQFGTILIGVAVLMALATGCQQPTSRPPTKVTLQLKWIHQAQFAGYYVAKDKGYYAEENLDVTFVPAGPGINIIERVVSGQADFGVAAPEHILLQRSQGQPVVAIATTYRRNPFVLVTLAESGITHPADMVGKTAMLGGTDGLLQFNAMIKKLGLDLASIKILPYSFDLTPFYNGEVDIAPAFAAGSLIGILQTGRQFNLIWPSDYGITVYSDTIVTTDQMIATNPDLVTRFLRATLKGHRYAVENPEEALAISLNYAENADPAVQAKMIEASRPLIHTGEDHIGWMRAEVWQQMEEMLLDQGFLTNPADLDKVYTMQFLEAVYGDTTP
ncbi:MAG: Riboflavin-binding protein RibY [Anaerolineae bacterium]|nr:Riboflavin-binding protein RibY [Anaerolineae bacterium]